ncbi:hypothetical protein [Kamptonema sp. UHCC 0994]|uniref:hypothetical protein n=1 Tax=Kamptonema sp. UHCC 0994 TaxID=3031329 RepID=UPI0023BB0298|nr:hypothetical protein [Kamptonema sp. UHCC 0994]MDF0556923.1 hypothetical protein [Kamptonema sp. UHCC 0994]
MQTSQKWLDPETLKLTSIPGKESQTKHQPLLSLLKRIFEPLVAAMIRRDEFRIWQTSDRYGNTLWHAYDPATGRSTSVATEEEMRVWIEKRYYK